MCDSLQRALSKGAFDIKRYNWDVDGLVPLFIIWGGLLEAAGAALLVLGHDRQGATLLLLFMVPATLLMHQPLTRDPSKPLWTLPHWLFQLAMEPEAALQYASELALDRKQLIEAMKNLAIIGGLIALRAETPAGEGGAPRARSSDDAARGGGEQHEERTWQGDMRQRVREQARRRAPRG